MKARMTVGALVGAAAVLTGGGSALAAGEHRGDPGAREARCQAVLERVAEKRGLTPAELETLYRNKIVARIDAALAAGRITPEQAARLKQRVAEASPCKVSPVLKAKVAKKLAKHRMFRAAAAYLELTPAELRKALPGTSLAALAESRGKSVDGLKAAMLAPAQAKLAKAVANGRITQARADRMLERLEAYVDRVVAFAFPER